MGPINNNSALVQIIAWRRTGDKPLYEPMMVSLLTHTCATRPQWVKHCLNANTICYEKLRKTLHGINNIGSKNRVQPEPGFLSTVQLGITTSYNVAKLGQHCSIGWPPSSCLRLCYLLSIGLCIPAIHTSYRYHDTLLLQKGIVWLNFAIVVPSFKRILYTKWNYMFWYSYMNRNNTSGER